ncbi:ribonuclease H-like domain-containing protein [Tanacetum coccineum]|uniref:Ribonuclease H-like domain-containing protein n=1 Tax=Tanacetum coccineum TaxID=301880 RepID=A0ABQ5H7T6_9ASTR
MDPSSSVGKTCLGENVIEISSDKSEVHGDWNSPEFQDTTNSGGKKETKAMIFHKMETEEISNRFVAPCFVNGLEAYDGEINLGLEENVISNEFAVKLCLEHEVKHGNKVVKKELIVALRGEIYFVKFIINPEEDDVEPGVVFGRSFMHLTKAIADFGNETITIYHELNPFLVSSEEEEKIGDDWDLLLDDLDFGDIPDIEGEAEKEALAISICERYSLLEEERPVIETMAYSDKYKKILDEICLDKMKLDGMNKEEEEAIIRIKGEALIEKDDPGVFFIPIRLESKIKLNALVDIGSDINVIPCRIYKELGREEVQNVKKGISMLDHSKVEPMRLLSNVLCQVGVTTIIAKFLILDMPIDRDTPILVGRGFLHTCGGILNTIDNIMSTFDGICHQTFRAAKTSLDNAEIDSDDEEEYAFQRNKFGAPIYGPKPAKKICVWKKVVSFLGSLPVALQHVEWKPDYTGCFNKKEDIDGQWHAEIRLTDPLWEETMMKPDHQDPNALDNTKPWRRYCSYKFTMNFWNGKVATEIRSQEIDEMLRINLYEAGTNEEIFTSVAWIRAFNINEPIYSELCHEFYSTYEKLGLYHAKELDEEGFDVYFQGGLRSDEHFNAQEYWLSISREKNLSLSRSRTSTIRNLKPKWVCECCLVNYEVDEEERSWYSEREFITKLARKAMVLSDEVLRSLSALIYYRDLDTTTLRELIDSEGRLIPEDPQPDVPRVAIPRAQRASMQDLNERMGSIEIR